MTVPPLTWLYVPGDRGDRVEKAIASPAHAVIADLEDAVAPAAKDEARKNVRDLLGRPLDKRVHVRINGLRSGRAEADARALAGLSGVAGVHVPKVESPSDVRAARKLLPESLPMHALIESAAAVESAYEIARSGVAGLSLGEADLRSETGALEPGLDWVRSRLVNAAVAAGFPRPPQSVYPNVRDEEGLRRSCERGRALGHLGRAAIHPAQLPIIEQAYLPTVAELDLARETLERLEEASGAAALEGGEFVDSAMRNAALAVVAIADRYGTAGAV